jgi:hypothetical protein
MKQNILYSSYKTCVPSGSVLRISDDNKDISYYDKLENKRIITTLDNYDFNLFNDFLKPVIINSDLVENTCKLYLEIDTEKFNNVSKLNKLQNRKIFFSLITKCYKEHMYTYFSHQMINLLEDSLGKQYLHNYDDIPWMISKEFKSLKPIYQYPLNTFKLHDTYLDLENGIFYNKSKKEKVTLNGGILLDKTDHKWRDLSKELILKTYQSVPTNASKLFTEATLIICSQLMIQSWKNILINMTDSELIIITDKKSHKNTNFNKIYKSKIVIVSSEFLLTKNYSILWTDYRINESSSFNDINQIIKNEYNNLDNDIIKNIDCPILSLLKWKRVILDSSTVINLSKDPCLYELVFALDSLYKWIQILEFPFLRDDLVHMINLVSSKKLIFPLFDKNDKTYLINDIIRQLKSTDDKKKINVTTIKVNINKYENQLCNYVDKNYMTSDDMDDILFNFKTKTELNKINILIRESSNQIIRLKENKDIDKDCPVCFNNLCDTANTISVTKCGHKFCFSCILQNMNYSKQCPMCRVDLDYKSIYTITKTVIGPSKINKLILSIKNSQNKNIIYVKNYKEGKYLSKIMSKKKLSNIFCSGRIDRKNNLISNFNEYGDSISIILTIDDNSLSKSITNINNIHITCPLPKHYKMIDYYCDSIKTLQINLIKHVSK